MAAGQAGELAMSADANTPLAIFTVHAELPLKALQGEHSTTVTGQRSAGSTRRRQKGMRLPTPAYHNDWLCYITGDCCCFLACHGGASSSGNVHVTQPQCTPKCFQRTRRVIAYATVSDPHAFHTAVIHCCQMRLHCAMRRMRARQVNDRSNPSACELPSAPHFTAHALQEADCERAAAVATGARAPRGV